VIKVPVLDACRTHLEVGQFSDLVPAAVRADERFCRAVAAKLAAIKERRQDRKRA
jgi:hypothetical protein